MLTRVAGELYGLKLTKASDPESIERTLRRTLSDQKLEPTRFYRPVLQSAIDWIEPGFRNGKKKGCQWEDSQVRGVAHHQRLLLAMAWATLAILCLGLQEANAKLAALARRQIKAGRKQVGKPRHARESLFTMGLRCVHQWLYGNLDRAMEWLLRLARPAD